MEYLAQVHLRAARPNPFVEKRQNFGVASRRAVAAKLAHALTKLLGQQTRHHVHMHPIEHDGLGELRVGLHGEVKVRVVKSKSSAQVAELRLVQDGMHVLQAKQHHAKSRDSKRFEFIKIDIGAADVVGGVTGFHLSLIHI